MRDVRAITKRILGGLGVSKSFVENASLPTALIAWRDPAEVPDQAWAYAMRDPAIERDVRKRR